MLACFQTRAKFIINSWKVYHQQLKSLSSTVEKFIINSWKVYHQQFKSLSSTVEKFIINCWKVYHQLLKSLSSTVEKFIINSWKVFSQLKLISGSHDVSNRRFILEINFYVNIYFRYNNMIGASTARTWVYFFVRIRRFLLTLIFHS